MAVKIGEHQGSNFHDPIGLLTDCHRRIEKFLDVLLTVTQKRRGSQLKDEHREAFEVALRYFRESAPKHSADEEESLFPRVLTRAGTQFSLISNAIEALNAEHRLFAGIHEEVDRLGRCWLDDDFPEPHETNRLITIIQDLKEVYQQHIAIEEHDIFPFARKILSTEDLRSIGNEMAVRRNLPIERSNLSHSHRGLAR